ncbi:SGNH/GDSL hydrolase family protein [Sphingobacterium sp. N143]|nr:SGNH/GDSL hydrolase family protein [Sphingobacterium sp. N143]
MLHLPYLLLNRTRTRGYLLLLCLSLCCYLQGHAQDKKKGLVWDEAKQVLFLGNSITYAGKYVAMTESLFLTSHPKHKPQFINLGLPSETLSGLSEPNHADGRFPRPCLFDRLDSVLSKINPEVVFVCYGMNDGIYLPLDAKRFEAYKTGVKLLHDQLKKKGVKHILWMTPPVHDDPKLRLNGYNKVLDRYAEWLLQYGHRHGWEVIDLHFPMKRYLEEHIQGDPAFKLAADGVHPGVLGHWLMAREIVRHLMPSLPVAASWEEQLANDPKLGKLYELVWKQQTLMKDAWLTYTGHKRPGLNKGRPLPEAQHEYQKIQRELQGEGF